MGKVDLFQIVLEKPNGIYIAGELICGNLIMKITERLKINNLRLLMKGYGRVHWTERRSSGKSSHTVSYTAEEEYIHYNMIILAKQGNNDCYIEVGQQSFPFQIQLPQILPTSFEHANARVRYTLKGDIDIPWAFDKSVSITVTVLSHVDLNVNPVLIQPASGEEMKTMCCLCCKSDPIFAKLSIFKTGFVSGEVLSFKGVIDNKSSYTISQVSFQLIQNIFCITRSKSRFFKRIVMELPYSNKISNKKNDEWNGSIIIPPVCPSSRGMSNIMDISYSVLLYINPSGPHTSFTVVMPIVIGTVPLAKGNYQNNQTWNFEASGFATENNSALDEKSKGESNNMNSNYSPSYPVYKDLSITNQN